MQNRWMYQGRQSHGWFGHGTAPHDALDALEVQLTANLVDQRIRDLGHTLVAGLPRSRRYHNAVQLSSDDQARLTRLLRAVVKALPLGPATIANHIFAKPAETPGIAGFIQAAGLLRNGRDNADLRAATDALGQAVQDIGLDQFKTFLHRADDQLTTQGSLLTLVRDMTPTGAPSQVPIGSLARRGSWASAGVGLALLTLDTLNSLIEQAAVRDTIQRFGLDASKRADVIATYAFLWAESYGPWLFDTPQTGPDMLAMAELIMRVA